jgi:hypothetical protein
MLTGANDAPLCFQGFFSTQVAFFLLVIIKNTSYSIPLDGTTPTF